MIDAGFIDGKAALEVARAAAARRRAAASQLDLDIENRGKAFGHVAQHDRRQVQPIFQSSKALLFRNLNRRRRNAGRFGIAGDDRRQQHGLQRPEMGLGLPERVAGLFDRQGHPSLHSSLARGPGFRFRLP